MIQQIGRHKVTCGNIAGVQVDEMLAGETVSILYSDPPWGDGNLKYWQTQNRKMTGQDVPQISHDLLYDRMAHFVRSYVRGHVFIETGKRWAGYVEQRLKAMGLEAVRIHATEYKSGSGMLPAVLLTGVTNGYVPVGEFNPHPYTGVAMVSYCLQKVNCRGGIAFDPCCGMGYTARAAVLLGMSFRGNELNAKRLSKTIEFLRKSS